MTAPTDGTVDPTAEWEDRGMWLGSGLGVSFHCACNNWVSDRYGAEDVMVLYRAVREHIATSHLGRGQ
jgi:hypothetical protein